MGEQRKAWGTQHCRKGVREVLTDGWPFNRGSENWRGIQQVDCSALSKRTVIPNSRPLTPFLNPFSLKSRSLQKLSPVPGARGVQQSLQEAQSLNRKLWPGDMVQVCVSNVGKQGSCAYPGLRVKTQFWSWPSGPNQCSSKLDLPPSRITITWVPPPTLWIKTAWVQGPGICSLRHSLSDHRRYKFQPTAVTPSLLIFTCPYVWGSRDRPRSSISRSVSFSVKLRRAGAVSLPGIVASL